MTCRELADFIIDYVDGGLDAGVQAQFERHLTRCPNCVRYLDAYRASIDMSRRALAADGDRPATEAGAPADLIDAILASLPRRC